MASFPRLGLLPLDITVRNLGVFRACRYNVGQAHAFVLICGSRRHANGSGRGANGNGNNKRRANGGSNRKRRGFAWERYHCGSRRRANGNGNGRGFAGGSDRPEGGMIVDVGDLDAAEAYVDCIVLSPPRRCRRLRRRR